MTFRFVGAVGILLGAVTFSACADRRFFGEPESKTLRDSGGAEYAAHELVFMPSAQGTADKLKAIYETMGAEVINETAPLSQSLGYVHLKLSPAMSADEAATLLLDSGLAESTEKNYVARIDVTPGDPSWDSLWGLRAIHGEEAWEISKGSDETVVAVLDTGIQYDHPDLDANIWTNEGETPGNGVDDDGNGWVDDVRGWNFGRSTGRASNDPYDIHSHGTHVAGTVGAVGDNGVGVVGVNWTVQIIAVNVFSKIGSGVGAYSTDIINGFVYAAANGAKAVNTSLGSYRRSSNLETNAVADLNDRGVLLVAAAGNMENNNDRNPHWPSNVDLANVIAVAAMKSDLSLTDRNDWGYKNGQPAGSSYGATTVDLAAPGHQINSTVPGSGYAKFSGTSMAAPHVAGAVALFYSQFPKVGHLEMKAHLLGSTQPSSSLSGKVLTGGYLDLKKLLRDFRGPPAPPRDFVAQVGPNRSIQVQWNWEAVMDPPSQDLAGFDLRYRPVGTTAYQELNLNPSDRVYELKGLTHETAYSVEIRSRGENGGLSEWVVSQDVLVGDNVAPAKVVDLMVSYPEGEEVNFAIMPGLESIDEYWSGAHLNDRRSETGWIAPYRSIDFEETLLIHLSEVVEIDQLHLLPNSVYPEFFPGTVQVETSLDGAAFEYGGVLRTAGNVASGQWQSVVMIPREAEWLRIHLSDAYSHASGRYYLGLSEVMVRKLRQDPMRLGLQFRAPGDDPDSGRAAKYEFYYSRYLGNTGGLANAQKLF